MKPVYWALPAVVSVLVAAGCATGPRQMEAVTAEDLNIIKASFRAQGQAGLDRLDQDDAQKHCSNPPTVTIAKELAARIEKANFAAIKYPADGNLMGDWRAGERIAQTGVGMQFSDNPKTPSGGNCYACHQVSKEEISFGTIGPSLYNYGKLRGGASPEMQRYTYGRIYNPQAFTACSNMPRFGHNGILTEQQIRDVTALLLDPNSPVNQ
ncbi:MAG: sulfur oxidation c-type cytochrome SoxX [Burkholderiales bacterium]|nr:sulfur oxidation c-type cytochrome SoxX [Burkholderiales bacterium]